MNADMVRVKEFLNTFFLNTDYSDNTDVFL